VVFILDARRIAKRRQGGKRDCGVAQGYEQFGSQRGERSIACARLTRSPTYDLDAREEEKRADDIGRRGAETVTPPRDRRAARHDATGDSKDAYFAGAAPQSNVPEALPSFSAKVPDFPSAAIVTVPSPM
jgi:hypothetical protein